MSFPPEQFIQRNPGQAPSVQKERLGPGRRICRISHNPPPLVSCFSADKPKDQKRLTLIEGTGGIILKVREIIKVIEAEGWYLVTTKGSHRQYKHPVKTGRITIAGHLNDDLAPGTMNSICKQAKIKE